MEKIHWKIQDEGYGLCGEIGRTTIHPEKITCPKCKALRGAK